MNLRSTARLPLGLLLALGACNNVDPGQEASTQSLDGSSSSSTSAGADSQSEGTSSDAPLITLELDQNALELDIGQRKRVRVMAIDEAGVESDVTDEVSWISTGDAEFTVDNGWVEGVATGDGMLHASHAGLESDVIPIRIRGWSDVTTIYEGYYLHIGRHLAAAGPDGQAIVAFLFQSVWTFYSFDASTGNVEQLPHAFAGSVEIIAFDAAGVLHVLEVQDDDVTVYQLDDDMVIDSTTFERGDYALSRYRLLFSPNRTRAVLMSCSFDDFCSFIGWDPENGWAQPIHTGIMGNPAGAIDDSGRIVVAGYTAFDHVGLWTFESSFEAPTTLDGEPYHGHGFDGQGCVSLSINGDGDGVALWRSSIGNKFTRIRDGSPHGPVSSIGPDDADRCHVSATSPSGLTVAALGHGYPDYTLRVFQISDDLNTPPVEGLSFEYTYSASVGANHEDSLWVFARATGSPHLEALGGWGGVRHDPDTGWQEPQSLPIDYLERSRVDFAPNGSIVAAFRYNEYTAGVPDSIRVAVYR
jgi:hypothetical protein